MSEPAATREFRRESPRVRIEALCWELSHGSAGDETSGIAVDLSSLGLRLERPYTGGPTRHAVGLQIEVPGIDEVMWARADACFDVVVPRAGAPGGALGLVRRTGYRITAAANRDLRMLKEFVIETDRVSRRQLAASDVRPPRDPVREADRVTHGVGDEARRAPRAAELGLASCYLRA